MFVEFRLLWKQVAQHCKNTVFSRSYILAKYYFDVLER